MIFDGLVSHSLPGQHRRLAESDVLSPDQPLCLLARFRRRAACAWKRNLGRSRRRRFPVPPFFALRGILLPYLLARKSPPVVSPEGHLPDNDARRVTQQQSGSLGEIGDPLFLGQVDLPPISSFLGFTTAGKHWPSFLQCSTAPHPRTRPSSAGVADGRSAWLIVWSSCLSKHWTRAEYTTPRYAAFLRRVHPPPVSSAIPPRQRLTHTTSRTASRRHSLTRLAVGNLPSILPYLPLAADALTTSASTLAFTTTPPPNCCSAIVVSFQAGLHW